MQSDLTLNALLPAVLKRGCPLYPETKAMALRLQELYGAQLDGGIKKKGDMSEIFISLSFPDSRYIKGDDGKRLFADALSLLESVLFKQTGFSKTHVEQEIFNQKNLILSIINDKRLYALMRCTEIMCKDEPYGLPVNGIIADLDSGKINEATLFEHYQKVISESVIDAAFCGCSEADADALVAMLKTALPESSTVTYPDNIVKAKSGSVRKVNEKDNVAQGKLSMGYRVGITAKDAEYPAAIVFNTLFGGGINSLLFNNVREKLSLCYYVSSRMDFMKGVAFVNSGIETANYDVAVNEITAQLDTIKEGKFSPKELEYAILDAVNGLRSVTDNQKLIEDLCIDRELSGAMDLDELIEKVKIVTADEVVDVANRVSPDVVYFLSNAE